jgi:S1-C subfamily serine protease
MMKGVLMVVAVVLLGCAQPGTTTNPWKTARSTTVLVDDLIGDIGTGVVVNDRCVVTAGHVADVDDLAITLESGKVIFVRRVAHDDQEDVAAICASVPIDAPTVSFSPLPAPYDPVFTIGFPLGFKHVLTVGHYQGGTLITAQCAPGNSGGGVFDGMGGYIGFVDSISVARRSTGNMTFPHLCNIVSSKTVAAFLTTNHITYQGRV